MQLSTLLTLALASLAAAQSCSTRNDCPGDQVCCSFQPIESPTHFFQCMEPNSACCNGQIGGINTDGPSSCDICSSPGVFDSPC